MIMPPVMGAASFIMAEYLRMDYALIMLAAAIPAVLYYISQYAYVHIEAQKLGMTRVPSEKITPVLVVMRRQGYMIIPVVVIVWLLLKGRTPLYAAFYGIVSSVLVTMAVSFFQGAVRTTLQAFLRALEQGARQCVSVGVACAVVGIINGIINMSGLGLTLGNGIVSLAHGSIFFTALLTMIVSIILGMGLPTTACYIITATIAAPALIKMGVMPLAAHMFTYYFACLSNLTPPVAIASYGAAGLSGQNPSEVGWAGFRIALAGFVIPFGFVYSPALLVVNNTLPEVAIATSTAFVGVVAAAVALQGYFKTPMNLPMRILLFAGACCLIIPEMWSDIVGLGIVLGAWAFQKYRSATGE
jgi:TRAP transporter 4TM/12TM fusion protein